MTPEQIQEDRIIPADAGSTIKKMVDSMNDEDHPHGCGEHAFANQAANSAGGSSPRMRGAQGAATCRPSRSGIIPADAGST